MDSPGCQADHDGCPRICLISLAWVIKRLVWSWPFPQLVSQGRQLHRLSPLLMSVLYNIDGPRIKWKAERERELEDSRKQLNTQGKGIWDRVLISWVVIFSAAALMVSFPQGWWGHDDRVIIEVNRKKSKVEACWLPPPAIPVRNSSGTSACKIES